MPKWQFLCHLTDRHEVLVHGSGDPHISEFEPRQSNDALEFGNQRAVYAASDGIWAMYYAVLDRERYVRSLVNACVRVNEPGRGTESRYYFSINGDALPHNPWQPGFVYILPRDGFERQPPHRTASGEFEVPQWRSFDPVKPLAKLSVQPSDFPFLARVQGHDPKTVRERARDNPAGFPWLDE
jgi:hypothetical protein